MDNNILSQILDRLGALEVAVIGHNGGPPLDTNEPDRRLPTSEVARRYGVSRRTIERWCSRPEFPKPDIVNKRKYFWLSQLKHYDHKTKAEP